MPKLILWFPLSIAILRNNALGEIKLIQAAARCCKCCCNACCTSSWNQELIGAIILSQGLVYGGWSTYMEPHPGIWPQVSSVQGKHALPICQLVHYFIMFAWDFLLNWQTQKHTFKSFCNSICWWTKQSHKWSNHMPHRLTWHHLHSSLLLKLLFEVWSASKVQSAAYLTGKIRSPGELWTQ